MKFIDRNNVVLVDQFDHSIGQMEKIAAHEEGVLHRAFSVFIFNERGELLLQQRAANKYHGAHLWTNTCCSHPQWGENVLESARERLIYEMGFDCDLEFSHSFIYRSVVENGLIEYEFDHVFVGYSNAQPRINSEEVQDYQWLSPHQVTEQIATHSDRFTYWFKNAWPVVSTRFA